MSLLIRLIAVGGANPIPMETFAKHCGARGLSDGIFIYEEHGLPGEDMGKQERRQGTGKCPCRLARARGNGSRLAWKIRAERVKRATAQSGIRILKGSPGLWGTIEAGWCCYCTMKA